MSARTTELAIRVVDLALAGVALVILAPVLALSALAVLATMGRPVVFRQPRAGLHGRRFLLMKLRTMRAGPIEGGAADARRLTRVGRVLRSTSIDELPQLWNVLRGDMSLVGPRPLLLEYLPLYTPRQARRHDVRPGITGWAQVRGRNNLPWEERFERDIWYVEHRSLALYLRILLMTVTRVMGGSGVSTPAGSIQPKFTGTPHEPAVPPDEQRFRVSDGDRHA